MYTFRPFFRYSAATSAVRCQQTMLCHSVRSFPSPLCLSLKLSLVAMLNLVTAVPCGVYLSSGSLPSVPIRMTLLTLFAMVGGSFAFDFGSSIYQREVTCDTSDT